MGDTFQMSGDFRGAILNIDSTLKNAQQSVNNVYTAGETDKAELSRLLEELNATLQKAPPDKKDDAEAVAETAKVLIDSASGEKPNKTLVKISAEGLKKAAENLAEIMPPVVAIATQIITAVTRLSA